MFIGQIYQGKNVIWEATEKEVVRAIRDRFGCDDEIVNRKIKNMKEGEPFFNRPYVYFWCETIPFSEKVKTDSFTRATINLVDSLQASTWFPEEIQEAYKQWKKAYWKEAGDDSSPIKVDDVKAVFPDDKQFLPRYEQGLQDLTDRVALLVDFFNKKYGLWLTIKASVSFSIEEGKDE